MPLKTSRSNSGNPKETVRYSANLGSNDRAVPHKVVLEAASLMADINFSPVVSLERPRGSIRFPAKDSSSLSRDHRALVVAAVN